MRYMKATMNCLPCIVRQAVEAALHSSDDPASQRAALNAAFAVLSRENLDTTPMALGYAVHSTVARVTGCADPYSEIKRESNREALAMYDGLVETVAQAADPLLAAAKIAIAGNIMDFAALESFDIRATVDKTLISDFAINDFGQMKAALHGARRVLYIADNAGEVVFDRVFIEQMHSVEVTVALKSEPFINDATLTDAREVGLDQVAELLTLKPGASSGNSFDEAWASADIIIAKGQGNYEVFSESRGPLFFLLLAKCTVIASDIGVNQMDMICQSQATRQARI